MDEEVLVESITELLERTLYISKFSNSKKELKEERKMIKKMYKDFLDDKYEEYIDADV